jgi:serine/threonine protein phosphatase PrpC
VRHYYADSAEPVETLERLHAALEAANCFVRDQASRIGFRRIGSTAAGLVLTPSGMALSFSIGDSRVYRMRKGIIEQLTRDQSVLARQLADGSITTAQAKKIRNSNVTAFLGQPRPIQPDFRLERAHPGDVFIICSDGLWSIVDPDEIQDKITNTAAPEATYKLVQLALERGAPDNVTVIVARIAPFPFWRNPRLIAAFLLLVTIFTAALLLTY